MTGHPYYDQTLFGADPEAIAQIDRNLAELLATTA